MSTKQGRENITGETPLISVIVPIYNVEKYIHMCIDSIRNQTYSNLEIILVDDGSLDSCGIVCDECANMDSRIKVIHQENGGLGAARNAGLEICTGDYITFVDSDDFLTEDCFERMIKSAGDADLVSCGYIRVGEDGTPETVLCPCEQLVFSGLDLLCKHYENKTFKIGINCVYVWGKLYKCDVWETLRFPIEMVFEDIAIMPQIFLECDKIKFLPYAGYNYRYVPQSITNNTSEEVIRKRFMDSLIIWENHIKFYEEAAMSALVTAVYCLRAESIIAKMMHDSIPNDLLLLSKSTLKKSASFLLFKRVPLKKKIQCFLFAYGGKAVYMFVRKIVNH